MNGAGNPPVFPAILTSLFSTLLNHRKHQSFHRTHSPPIPLTLGLLLIIENECDSPKSRAEAIRLLNHPPPAPNKRVYLLLPRNISSTVKLERYNLVPELAISHRSIRQWRWIWKLSEGVGKSGLGVIASFFRAVPRQAVGSGPAL